MARTRGTSLVEHSDDGELLDKEGKPINPMAHGSTWSGVSQQPNPDAEPVVEPPFPEGPHPEPEPGLFRCDVTTVQRDCDGWEAIRLLDVLLGGISAVISEDDFGKLRPDVRRHFKRIA